MSSNRENILAKLRRGAGPEMPPVALDRSDIAKHDWSTDEKIERFTERMTAVRAQVVETSRANWLETLEGLCREKGLNNLLLDTESGWGAEVKERSASSSQLPPLREYEAVVDEWKDELFLDVDSSLTSTLGAIAETGTIVLWPTVKEPRTLSLVPPVHFAVLEASKLYTTFAEVVREQNWASGMPTNALLISGPSKSADIEQTLAFGVHGPKELVVVLLRD